MTAGSFVSDEVGTVESSLLKREPAMIGAFVAWLMVQVGAFLVGHTHLFTHAQWGSLSTALTPVVSAALLGVVGKWVREQVSPAAKPGLYDVASPVAAVDAAQVSLDDPVLPEHSAQHAAPDVAPPVAEPAPVVVDPAPVPAPEPPAPPAV